MKRSLAELYCTNETIPDSPEVPSIVYRKRLRTMSVRCFYCDHEIFRYCVCPTPKLVSPSPHGSHLNGVFCFNAYCMLPRIYKGSGLEGLGYNYKTPYAICLECLTYEVYYELDASEMIPGISINGNYRRKNMVKLLHIHNLVSKKGEDHGDCKSHLPYFRAADLVCPCDMVMLTKGTHQQLKEAKDFMIDLIDKQHIQWIKYDTKPNNK